MVSAGFFTSELHGERFVVGTAKQFYEFDDRYEPKPDSDDQCWQTSTVVPKNVGFDIQSEDGVAVTLKEFVTRVHRPLQTPARQVR